MTAKRFILATGAILALAAPAANAATPKHPIRKVHKPLVKTQAPVPAFSGVRVVGPSCADTDPTYSVCVGAAWDANLPVPVAAIDASSRLQLGTRILSTLDDNTQDG